MLDPVAIPPVTWDELLSRFVLFSAHVRSDSTVKPDAFMPHPRIELSLTRHLAATDAELWQEGQRVATIRARQLYGRAVVSAKAFFDQGLGVEAKPIADNPNHADAVNWPPEKASQKLLALQIAAQATYHPRAG